MSEYVCNVSDQGQRRGLPLPNLLDSVKPLASETKEAAEYKPPALSPAPSKGLRIPTVTSMIGLPEDWSKK